MSDFKLPTRVSRYEANIKAEALNVMPTPAAFGIAVLAASGYLFASVDKDNCQGDRRIQIFNGEELIGYVTYLRRDSNVRVIVEDKANSIANNLLTSCASTLSGL